MKFDIVINIDDNYMQHCMAMLCSLYENNRNHEITLHVMMKSLSEVSKNYIKEISSRYNNNCIFYTINESSLDGVQFRKQRPLSKAAYYRLLLSSILPKDLNKVLYLDCDIIIVRDISEIFCIEIDNYALAASIDEFPYSQQHRIQLHMEADERTFCSGVMLINLKYWRENKCEDGLLEYARRHRKVVYLHDQDVLNYYFKKKWFLLPPKWNKIAGRIRPGVFPNIKKFDIDDYIKRPMLYHYASNNIKPWFNAYTPEKNIYLKYLQLSGFKEIIFLDVKTWTYIKFAIKSIKYNIKLYIARLIY